MITKTTASGPMYLGLPEPEPEPMEGCDVCGALSRERAAARLDGDLSKVSDVNVEMRAHQCGECA
ncbi:hypothetical protein [Streptomyces turgidiscabies]|uniref:Uncharacterized protein n=1 Tax=Streptomyces turgidiscabies TaxID=85558 RepID=A0ABU0RHI4_9ACTN|nr:hypothetical protein [Streptomyces turgidiscabies]MDQ0931435.1 hypothetical protein [Streptomyces turgidiscabies]